MLSDADLTTSRNRNAGAEELLTTLVESPLGELSPRTITGDGQTSLIPTPSGDYQTSLCPGSYGDGQTSLSGPFDSGDEQTSFHGTVLTDMLIADSTTPDRRFSPIRNRHLHDTWYELKQERPEPRRTVEFRNQFGEPKWVIGDWVPTSLSKSVSWKGAERCHRCPK